MNKNRSNNNINNSFLLVENSAEHSCFMMQHKTAQLLAFILYEDQISGLLNIFKTLVQTVLGQLHCLPVLWEVWELLLSGQQAASVLSSYDVHQKLVCVYGL